MDRYSWTRLPPTGRQLKTVITLSRVICGFMAEKHGRDKTKRKTFSYRLTTGKRNRLMMIKSSKRVIFHLESKQIAQN